MRLKCTIEVEYDVPPEFYGTDDPKKMCEIDESSLMDIDFLVEFLSTQDEEYKVKVEEVKEN